jgi:MFS family permease
MKYWKDHFSTGYRDSKGDLNVTASQTSEIVSILSAGTFFGALFSAPLADFLGRRLAMVSMFVSSPLARLLNLLSDFQHRCFHSGCYSSDCCHCDSDVRGWTLLCWVSHKSLDIFTSTSHGAGWLTP